MAFIEIEHASKAYRLVSGERFVALDDVTLSVERGEFICLLGPSGCGKSTLLNAVAGFDLATSGSITIDGVPVEDVNPRYVTIFQQYGLLPWRSVVGNIEFGLEAQGVGKKERRHIALEYLELVGLGDFANARPSELSGGMQQRVAIARGLATKPEVLFMDEPFGAVDAITRMNLQDDLLRITKEAGTTVLFVTHDIDEAVYLSDRIVVMTPNPGRVKSVLNNPLTWSSHTRTNGDFVVLRDRVFDLLNLKQDLEPDIVF